MISSLYIGGQREFWGRMIDEERRLGNQTEVIKRVYENVNTELILLMLYIEVRLEHRSSLLNMIPKPKRCFF